MNGGDQAQNLPKKFEISSHDQPLDYIFASASSNSFMGSRTMVSFGAVGGVNKTGSSFFQSFDQYEIGDEYLDEYLNQPEKKRRLSIDQVQFLERNFETENKLEPDRKIQLAKELGLQPRQIAIWFQNRRARCKTKQLETDYETLHDSYERLKSDYNNLLKENEKLKAKTLNLKDNGLAKDIETSNIESLDNKELMSESIPKQTTVDMISADEESNVSAVVFKNKEHVSAKSDLTDVDSSHIIDGIGSPLLQSGENYNFFETDRSDLSQNGEDNLNLELLQPAHIFPKMDGTYLTPAENSCYYRFPVEDHPFGFWSY